MSSDLPVIFNFSLLIYFLSLLSIALSLFLYRNITLYYKKSQPLVIDKNTLTMPYFKMEVKKLTLNEIKKEINSVTSFPLHTFEHIDSEMLVTDPVNSSTCLNIYNLKDNPFRSCRIWFPSGKYNFYDSENFLILKRDAATVTDIGDDIIIDTDFSRAFYVGMLEGFNNFNEFHNTVYDYEYLDASGRICLSKEVNIKLLKNIPNTSWYTYILNTVRANNICPLGYGLCFHADNETIIKVLYDRDGPCGFLFF